MHVEELKQKVESYRAELKGIAGTAVTFSKSGPVGISLVDAIVAAIESLERRIAELEARSGNITPLGTFPGGLESSRVHDEAEALQRAQEAAAAKVREKLKE